MARRFIDIPDGEYCAECSALQFGESWARGDPRCGADYGYLDMDGIYIKKSPACLSAEIKEPTDEEAESCVK